MNREEKDQKVVEWLQRWLRDELPDLQLSFYHDDSCWVHPDRDNCAQASVPLREHVTLIAMHAEAVRTWNNILYSSVISTTNGLMTSLIPVDAGVQFAKEVKNLIRSVAHLMCKIQHNQLCML